LATDLSAPEFVDRVRSALSESGEINGVCVADRIEIFTNEGSRFFWSPQLSIDITSAEDRRVLSCRFGPHPNVWTLYVAIHALGAVITLAAAIYGLSQHLSGQTPWALWALPASPVLAMLVWAMAFVGQSMGHEQMSQLRRFVEDLI